VYPSRANPDTPLLLSQSDMYPTEYSVNVTAPSMTDARRLVAALILRVEDIIPGNYSYYWIVSIVTKCVSD